MRRTIWVGLSILLVIVGVLLLPRKKQSKPAFRPLCELPWSEYAKTLEAARLYKDSVFQTSERSPIPTPDRRSFRGLRYFRLDSCWRIVGWYEALPRALAPVIGQVWVDLPSLDSCKKPTPLLVYGSRGGEEPYIAFWDSTAAQGLSYEGGRYVPVEIQGKKACLDFNRAYFPYCAYNPAYICLPYPPQNRLCLSVLAGERW
ncbi:MAG: DUF1684 domain-containing protein [Bacteroidia bacterium]|nr:DUF1684 domain-containing protein [Bacteroidia bacterium]